MKLTKLKPRKALNKAFLKVKPNRTDIERFKANLIKWLDRINDTESEEFHKNLNIDFLKKRTGDESFKRCSGESNLKSAISLYDDQSFHSLWIQRSIR